MESSVGIPGFSIVYFSCLLGALGSFGSAQESESYLMEGNTEAMIGSLSNVRLVFGPLITDGRLDYQLDLLSRGRLAMKPRPSSADLDILRAASLVMHNIILGDWEAPVPVMDRFHSPSDRLHNYLSLLYKTVQAVVISSQKDKKTINMVRLHLSQMRYLFEIPNADADNELEISLKTLHEGACCNVEGTWPHLAACNILTMISDLLNADETDRIDILRNGELYKWARSPSNEFGFSMHGRADYCKITSWNRWREFFPMTEADCRKAPSHAFVSILFKAGLAAWLAPGSDFSSTPSRSAEHLLFLTAPLNPDNDHLVYPDWAHTHCCMEETFTILDVLRSLAECVDFSATASTSMQDPHRVTELSRIASTRTQPDRPPEELQIYSHTSDTASYPRHELRDVIVGCSTAMREASPGAASAPSDTSRLNVHHAGEANIMEIR
ncbi:hypothetical protein PENSPDRAFT_736247 [Peniophora sp. CONT]|nr:hypothetical protein PENSPDRAFT_736247 [Peniophora sp. CONT]